jgi:hypothetical protein
MRFCCDALPFAESLIFLIIGLMYKIRDAIFSKRYHRHRHRRISLGGLAGYGHWLV